MTPHDPKSLRRAFGRYMTGVTVVTALTDDGAPVGFTANSFTSVSMDPPMLLVCPGRHLSSYPVFETARHFAISVLAADQRGVADRFARASDDRFHDTALDFDAHGCPMIRGRVAGFSCRTERCIPAGDHLILLGAVHGFDQRDRTGLGYGAGMFFVPDINPMSAQPTT